MSKPELLLTIPAVELHQVHNQQDILLHKDVLNLYLEQSTPQGSTVLAQVAGVSWRLYKTVPCLKSEDRTYIFSLPEQPGVFYCVILDLGTPPFVTESFEGVLRSSSDFSTMQPPAGAAPAAGVPPGPAGPQLVTPAPTAAPTEPSSMSKNVSSGLVTGSGVAAQGIVGLANLTAAGIQKVAEVVVKNTTPTPTGTMAPETRSKLEKATSMINQASTVIKQLACQAGKAAEVATKQVSTSLNKNESVQKFNSNPDVQVLGTASKAAGSQLMVGLKEAAAILSRSTQAAVQQYRSHKYPAEASQTVPAAPGPSGAPEPTYAPPQYVPPPMGQPGPHDQPLTAPPQMAQHPGPVPAGYPTVPAPPAGYPTSAPTPTPPPQNPQSGIYPDVQQPTLYPPQVPQANAQQPYPGQ